MSTATSHGVVKFGAGGRPAVAAVVAGAVSGDRGDHARGRIDLADGVVHAVGNEEIACGVHGDAVGSLSSARVAAPPSPL